MTLTPITPLDAAAVIAQASPAGAACTPFWKMAAILCQCRDSDTAPNQECPQPPNRARKAFFRCLLISTLKGGNLTRMTFSASKNRRATTFCPLPFKILNANS